MDVLVTQTSQANSVSLESDDIEAAVSRMAEASAEERGAIFTKREVVDFMLDLVGYKEDRPLQKSKILEPATGHGDFLLPTIDRLWAAYSRSPSAERTNAVDDLGECICAIELHRGSVETTRALVITSLQEKGISSNDAQSLANRWLRQGDYLLAPIDAQFAYVVGNPPYVRQELIPSELIAEYRRRYATIYDRADIYVPFIERSLSLLSLEGKLAFICADRWMKNKYGGPLRQLVAEHYHLQCYVDMVDTPAFHSDVIAYPAIAVIGRQKSAITRVAFRPQINAQQLKVLASELTASKFQKSAQVREVVNVASGSEPWMLGKIDKLEILRRLESDFPLLEDVGCKVGIGVATGSDRVFIAPFDNLDVEADRKLPLAMTRDISSGEVNWRGFGVINPFGTDGKLVALEDYPKLAKYLDAHGAAIKARHIAKKNPASWYRTIDRIYPELAKKPKLLIPDIKGDNHIVFEQGELYPHHNLYYVTSDDWDLRALQAVLMSKVTKLVIELYSTKMRGGYLRFQAQYLRRLRIPSWSDVQEELRARLISAACSGDRAACNVATAELYNLSPEELNSLNKMTEIADAA